MHKDWPKLAQELNVAIKDLRTAIPETAKGFSALAQAATAPGALDPKTKELIATAIAISSRCDGCITYHSKACVDHGATREEMAEMIGVALFMGGGPSLIYGAQALEAFDQYAAKKG